LIRAVSCSSRASSHAEAPQEPDLLVELAAQAVGERADRRLLLTTERPGARSEPARFADREVDELRGCDDTVQEAGVDRILWWVQTRPYIRDEQQSGPCGDGVAGARDDG
jgi:hypothetical protein